MTEEQQNAPAGAVCTECSTPVPLPDDAVAGEIVDCPDCGVELEIKNPETGTLAVAEVEGEDWGQ